MPIRRASSTAAGFSEMKESGPHSTRKPSRARANRPAESAGGFEQGDFQRVVFGFGVGLLRRQFAQAVRRGEAADAASDDDDAPPVW